MFLIFVNIFLLLFDIFVKPLLGVMVLAPVLGPVSFKLGIDPIHFAMLVMLTFWPALSTWVPHAMGFK